MNEVKDLPEVGQESEKLPEEKQTAKLDRWTYDGGRLRGIVYDHPRLCDGEIVTTTEVQWFDLQTKIAETKNTVYILLQKAM